ncbi:WDR41 [Mytilus coruscus]|uniref:WDR41 n=1 Tax=Mytilus coruscus TaxID=42192 RepID=A0A6J8B7U8_MYTCO|nr:WDR41 [Mytilus coruscus]
MSFLQRLFKGGGATKKEDFVPTIENEEDNPYTELTLLQHHTDIVRQVFVIDRRRCLSVADDNSAVIWDLLLGIKVAVLTSHTRPITCILLIKSKVHSSPYTLVTGSSDKQIKVWDYEQGLCLQTITEHNTSVKCLLLLQNECFISGGEKLHLWSPDGILLDTYDRVKEEADVKYMIIVRNEKIVATSNREIFVFHVVARQCYGDTDDIKQELALFLTIPQRREAIKCLVNISETMFAIGCLDGCIYVLSSETYQTILQFTSPEKYKGDHSDYPYSIQDMISADQRFLVAAVGSGFAIFDIKMKKIICKPHISHFSKILHLTFVCNQTLLATSSEDGSIRLWGQIADRQHDTQVFHGVMERFFNKSFGAIDNDMKSNSLPEPVLIGECLAHSGAVNMAVDGGDDVMVSCGVDGLVICWKNAELQKIKRNQIFQKEVLMGSGIV